MTKLSLTDVTAAQNQTSLAAAINSNNTQIETALENTLSRDGTTPNSMGSDLDMDSNRIYNLPNAADPTEPVTLGQLNGYIDVASTDQLVSTIAEVEGIRNEVLVALSDTEDARDAAAASAVAAAAFDSSLYLTKADNLASLANTTTSRTNLGLATVASSGSYTDLTNKPTLGTAASLNSGTSSGNVPVLGGSGRLSPTVVQVGACVGMSYATFSSSANITSVIPFDDTIPTSTEGVQVLYAEYTPKFSNSTLKVSVKALGSASISTHISLALFIDGDSSASVTTSTYVPDYDAVVPLDMVYLMTSGSTTNKTFSVRTGLQATGYTMRLNGISSARRFGGTAQAIMIIEEFRN